MKKKELLLTIVIMMSILGTCGLVYYDSLTYEVNGKKETVVAVKEKDNLKVIKEILIPKDFSRDISAEFSDSFYTQDKATFDITKGDPQKVYSKTEIEKELYLQVAEKVDELNMEKYKNLKKYEYGFKVIKQGGSFYHFAIKEKNQWYETNIRMSQEYDTEEREAKILAMLNSVKY